MLTKTSATDYATNWQTPSAGGLTLPLTQNLTFSPDNTYDIGPSGASRPRDLFLGRNLTVSGTSQLTGNVQIGVGQSPQTSIALFVSGTTGSTDTFQTGISAGITFSSAATNYGKEVYVQFVTQATTFTMTTGYGLHVDTPFLGAGSSVTTVYGLQVSNQGGTGRTNAYGVYIANQSGAATTNIGLYNAGTTTLIGAASITQIVQAAGAANNQLGRTGIGTAANNTDPSYDLRVNGAAYLGSLMLGGGNLSTNGSITAGGPVQGQYLTTNGNIQTLGGQITVGSANERIRNPVNNTASLSIESTDGYAMLMGKGAALLGGNAYYDGTNWQRFDVATGAMHLNFGPTSLAIYSAPSGANPITNWTQQFLVNSSGTLFLPNGSVTTPMLATGAATSVIAIYTAGNSFATSTTNAWIETTIQATGTNTGAMTRVDVATQFYHSAANAGVYVAWGLDGVIQNSLAYVLIPTAGNSMQVSSFMFATPAAGAHRYSIFVQNQTVGTLTIQGAAVSSISATEFRR